MFRELDEASNQGLNATAIELAERFLREYPKSGWAWFVYGNALASFSRYNEDETALRRAIKHVPTEHLHFVYGHLGHLFHKKGNYRKAALWYEKAAILRLGNADYLNYLGAALADDGNLVQASKCFRRATKSKNGAIDEAYYNLGCMLAAERKYSNAQACFIKALEIDPKYKLAKQALRDIQRVLEIKMAD